MRFSYRIKRRCVKEILFNIWKGNAKHDSYVEACGTSVASSITHTGILVGLT